MRKGTRSSFIVQESSTSLNYVGIVGILLPLWLGPTQKAQAPKALANPCFHLKAGNCSLEGGGEEPKTYKQKTNQQNKKPASSVSFQILLGLLKNFCTFWVSSLPHSFQNCFFYFFWICTPVDQFTRQLTPSSSLYAVECREGEKDIFCM